MHQIQQATTSRDARAIIDQFHQHIDRVVTSTQKGRIDRAQAHLSAAERLLGAIPSQLLNQLELTGYLRGVISGLQLDQLTGEPITAA